MIDYTKLKRKISPAPDGEDKLILRVGTVDAVNSDGTLDVTISGVVQPDIPVLAGAQHAGVGAVVQVLSYRGSLLVIGTGGGPLAAPVSASVADANSGNTNSTGGTNTLTGTNGGVHGVAFIAPVSGTVSVLGRCSAGNNAASGFTILDFEVKTGNSVGSGSTFRGPSNNSASSFQSDSANQFGSHTTTGLVTGLTPGDPYNAALVYSISGGTSSSWNRRYISVIPL